MAKKKETKDRKFKLTKGQLFRTPVGLVKTEGIIKKELELKEELDYTKEDIEYMLREGKIQEV